MYTESVRAKLCLASKKADERQDENQLSLLVISLVGNDFIARKKGQTDSNEDAPIYKRLRIG